jgi:hypothetical protein
MNDSATLTEVQVYDSDGVQKDAYPGIECGGIYPRWIHEQNVDGHSPRLNTSKPPESGKPSTFFRVSGRRGAIGGASAPNPQHPRNRMTSRGKSQRPCYLPPLP